MMTDKELEELSYTIDNFMMKMNDKYGASALSLSAVMLARMMLLCDSLGGGKDFRKLCKEVSNPFETAETFH